MRIPIIILVIALGIVFAPYSYGQNSHADKPIQIITGQVSQIDWVASTIVVRWLQPNGVTVFDEMVFSCLLTRALPGTMTLLDYRNFRQGTTRWLDMLTPAPGPCG